MYSVYLIKVPSLVWQTIPYKLRLGTPYKTQFGKPYKPQAARCYLTKVGLPNRALGSVGLRRGRWSGKMREKKSPIGLACRVYIGKGESSFLTRLFCFAAGEWQQALLIRL